MIKIRSIDTNIIIICMAMLGCCFLLSPLYEIPQNDDWAYYLVIKSWFEHGALEHQGWNDPTFVFQAYWGMFFVKVFGLSFSSLRLSTLVLATIGIISLYLILIELQIRKNIALLSSLLLIFNPISLTLSYSYNTDIPYLSLITLSQLFLIKAIKTEKIIYFLLTGIFIACSAMTRQTALLALIIIVIYILFIYSHNKKPLIIFLLSAPTIIAFIFYYHWMSAQTIQGWPFVTNNPLHINQPHFFLDAIKNSLFLFLNLPYLILPLVITYFYTKPNKPKKETTVFWLIIVTFFIVGFKFEFPFFAWPYFSSYLGMGIFFIPMELELLISFFMAFCLILFIFNTFIFLKKLNIKKLNFVHLLIISSLFQLAPTLFTERIYDRYIIVLLPPAITLLALSINGINEKKLRQSYLLFFLFFLFSLELLRGYLSFSSARWELALDISQKIPPDRILSLWEWQGLHLYPKVIGEKGMRPPYSKIKTGIWPWASLIKKKDEGCIIGFLPENEPSLLTISYNSAFNQNPLKFGVADGEWCRLALDLDLDKN